MFHAASDGLEARLASGRPISGYNGFDPSGPWLHIGHLHRTMGVELQMGGADQWGNITAGLELIRRQGAMSGDSASPRTADGSEAAFALAYPLLLAPSGAKFGKSEGGDTIWLDES